MTFSVFTYSFFIEYNPRLSEVPRGARVAYAKFMTKKITVDYNQETQNNSAVNEQPKRESKILKEKQHSLISLRSHESQKSQGKHGFLCFYIKENYHIISIAEI